jgi:uncharacterized membrane protein
MKLYLKLFCLAFPILIALDASWIGVIASSFYKANLGELLTQTPNYFAALLFYIFYVIGIIYFALAPALREQSFMRSIYPAAMLGFTSYMLYDLTNLAVLVSWPPIVAVVDIAWGVIITTLTSGLTYIVATKVYKL